MSEHRDRRIRKTEEQLVKGLTKLMKTKSIKDITVRELADEVDINRSTFYLHYETISDLLEETIEHIQAEFQKSFHIEAGDFIEEIDKMPLNELILINDKFLHPYLNFVKEHAKEWCCLCREELIPKSL